MLPPLRDPESVMKRIAACIVCLFALAAPARAAGESRLLAQVPLVPPGEATLPEDVLAFLYALWPDYYNSVREGGFTRDNLRLGRIDLNGDGTSELVLMVDAPGWEAAPGNPFVVAQWRRGRWLAVGWGWGDEDTVFATDDTSGGWLGIDGGKATMRWNGKEYHTEEKP